MVPPRKRHRRRKLADRELPPIVGAYSIPSFCAAHGHLSEAMYFKMKGQGLGPVEMRVGNRILISAEAAAAWRRQRETAAAESTATI